ncbi:XRE family transcriptional regulator [Microbacterium testaceum]|uniref:XRE family transcriptional regulator n=1 Tax=Microbacterium testaceum TaxID=2033 RepID=A0A147EZK7_MICTE|nr:response regulator transcription factor [Microbacterium testaceum]KTR95513.1 XRE family transcriptional regulator [Microbacterium testaceum]
MTAERGLIVVVEDEHAIADVARLYLVEAGFGVHLSRDGLSGLADIRRLRPAAAVVDIGLPGLDGIELVRRLRAENDWTPVLFSTARDAEVDRVLGLELGGDDYLTKPSSPRELATRVSALVRRSRVREASTVLRRGSWELDATRRTVHVDGRPVDLTTTEFDLLAQLMRSPGQVFTRTQLLAEVWGVADYSGTRTVDTHIAQVRAKMGAPDRIRTVRGVGYALDA